MKLVFLYIFFPPSSLPAWFLRKSTACWSFFGPWTICEVKMKGSLGRRVRLSMSAADLSLQILRSCCLIKWTSDSERACFCSLVRVAADSVVPLKLQMMYSYVITVVCMFETVVELFARWNLFVVFHLLCFHAFLLLLLCTSFISPSKHLLNRMRVDNVRRPCVSVCIRVCPCITSFYVGGCGAAAGFGSRTMVCLNGLSIVPQTSCLPC